MSARYATLKTNLKLLFYLNAADMVLTLVAIGAKLADEANPLMDFFLSRGVLAFGAVKMTLTVGGLLLLWRGRQSKWSLPAASALVYCYALVVAYEVVMVLYMLWG